MRDRIIAWNDVTGDDLAAVGSALGAIQRASSAADVSLVTAACQQLKDAVVTFEADPPAPDAKLRAYLAHANDSFSTAATMCVSGDYATTGQLEGVGTQWLKRAVSRLDVLRTA
jgi:hypothetical protein